MMASVNVALTINDIEVAAKVTFNYTPAVPARISGPMEDCYPEEPAEYELISLMYDNTDLTSVLAIEELEDSIIEQLEDYHYDNDLS